MRIACLSAFLLSFTLMTAVAAQADEALHEDFARFDTKRWYTSNGWTNGDWQSCEWHAANVLWAPNRLQLKLDENGGQKRPLGCAETHTVKRTGYGVYEARMKTVAGSGLNTAFFTYIGPPNGVKEWDEIDFEFLGKEPTGVQVNFYADGKSPGGVMVPLGFDATQAFHDYAIDTEPTKIRWYVDGKLVHESPDGAALPHNPTLMFLSLWSGEEKGGWLGPFHYDGPKTAEVAWAGFTPAGQRCLFPESMTCK